MAGIGFIFPGQGAQKQGMGKEIYDEFAEARELMDQFPTIRDYCFSGTEEELKKTSITQPSVFLVSAAIQSVLNAKGIKPVLAAGHSLGEYAALVAAGYMDAATAMDLVQERGRLMQEAGQRFPGTMAAIVGLEDDQVIKACEEAQGTVEAVNFNAPGQVVISGEVEAVDNVLKAVEEEARMTIPLNVSGAFHSSLLKETGQAFLEKLKAHSFQDGSLKVIANIDAEFYAGSSDVPDKLSRQIYGPVQWVRTVQKCASEEITDLIESGPGNVLKGLVRRIDRRITVWTTDTADSLNTVIAKFSPTGGTE